MPSMSLVMAYWLHEKHYKMGVAVPSLWVVG